jgi:hypothetical protein
MSKEYKEKPAIEMSFDEFVTWATAKVLFGIGEGQKLRDLMWLIIHQAVMNEIFGGQKRAKNNAISQ